MLPTLGVLLSQKLRRCLKHLTLEPDIVNPIGGKCMFSIENFFGTLALITSLIGLLPQVYKAYITKSTQDVSLIMLINYLVCSIAWIVYGLCQGSVFVVWSNIAGLVISILCLSQKIYYDRRVRLVTA
jgi:MtN3 and saliva related transmembrane protein